MISLFVASCKDKENGTMRTAKNGKSTAKTVFGSRLYEKEVCTVEKISLFAD